jgi:hypothetical protein
LLTDVDAGMNPERIAELKDFKRKPGTSLPASLPKRRF